jgi:predicted small integral membrane protein
MPQGTLFPIHYNPETPHETTHSTAAPTTTRNPLLIIGILGSVVLSLAWLLILRGCH